MADFCKRMARDSRRRAMQSRARVGEAALLRCALDTPPPEPLRLRGSGFDLIAEIKRRAPSAAVPARAAGFRVARRARAYAEAGVAAISVLTEPREFRGSLDDLREAARATRVPLMRKDFLVDPYQVLEARAAGASGVLLILRLLDDARLAEMLDAARTTGLFVLLEAFDGPDLRRADRMLRPHGPGVTTLVGLNCRDLATLDHDRSRFRALRPAMPVEVPAVAESGLQSPEDVRRIARLGYRAALVGSALMASEDPSRLARAMLAAGRQEVETCTSA